MSNLSLIKGVFSREKPLKDFLLEKDSEISIIQLRFIELFNECGKRFDSNEMQLAFAGAVILVLLKNTNAPRPQLRQLLENIKRKA